MFSAIGRNVHVYCYIICILCLNLLIDKAFSTAPVTEVP
jgi:hypothetical protein